MQFYISLKTDIYIFICIGDMTKQALKIFVFKPYLVPPRKQSRAIVVKILK